MAAIKIKSTPTLKCFVSFRFLTSRVLKVHLFLLSTNYYDGVNCCHTNKCKKVKDSYDKGKHPGFIRKCHKQSRDTDAVYIVIPVQKYP